MYCTDLLFCVEVGVNLWGRGGQARGGQLRRRVVEGRVHQARLHHRHRDAQRQQLLAERIRDRCRPTPYTPHTAHECTAVMAESSQGSSLTFQRMLGRAVDA
jgi:hypothetical protein